MSAVLATNTVDCPFCGHGISIEECPVVATNFLTGSTGPGSLGGVTDDLFGDLRAEFDDDDDDDDDSEDRTVASVAVDSSVRPVSGGRSLGRHGEFPVLARPPFGDNDVVWADGCGARGRGGFEGLRSSSLPELADIGSPEDLPARACPHCSTALPDELWDGEVRVIGLVGTNLAGKTHFLASTFYAACQLQGLAPYGFDDVRPDEATSIRLYEEYYPLFTDGKVLEKTQVHLAASARTQPLKIRMRGDGGARRSILLHDIAGEVLRDPRARANDARYLRYASGIVFLIDPVGYPAMRQRLGIDAGPLHFGQDQIVAGVLDMLGAAARDLPVAFVVTKADLLAEAFPEYDYRFREEAPTDVDAFRHQLVEINSQTESLIWHGLGDPALVNVMRQFPNRTLHCMASIGQRPQADGSVAAVKPMRPIDPLYSILSRLV